MVATPTRRRPERIQPLFHGRDFLTFLVARASTDVPTQSINTAFRFSTHAQSGLSGCLHLGIGAGLGDLLDEPVLRYVDRLAGGLFGLLDADRYIRQKPSDHFSTVVAA